MNDKGYRDWEELFVSESAENITAMTDILLESGISLGENCVKPLTLHNMKPKILRAFINYGWNVNSRDEEGMTPLMHIMSAYLSADCVKVLVEAGAYINATANDGATAFTYAAMYIYALARI